MVAMPQYTLASTKTSLDHAQIVRVGSHLFLPPSSVGYHPLFSPMFERKSNMPKIYPRCRMNVRRQPVPSALSIRHHCKLIQVHFYLNMFSLAQREDCPFEYLLLQVQGLGREYRELPIYLLRESSL